MDCPVIARLVLGMLSCLSGSVIAEGVLRDPTQPPAAFSSSAATESPVGDLRLEAIRRLHGAPSEALINGEFRRVGQEVAGRKLVRIGDREVVLQQGDQQETLRLAPEVEKIMKTNRKDRPGAETSPRGGV